MVEKLRFIHCADLHIDSPFKGLEYVPEPIFKEIKQSTFYALDQLVQVAIQKQVDFVLMVGDVFDQSAQSVYAQMRFLDACKKLNQHDIQIYLSFGNHDYIERGLVQLDFPPNVHIFQDQRVTNFIYKKENQDIATIYGFSYQNQAVYENKTPQFQKSTNTPYHIGMLHGSIEQNSSHDTYAPFKLQELISKNFDYWALGHIHKRTEWKHTPPIIYPGNTQGRSKKETGEKGCYFVELNKHQATLSFIPLQAIRFEQVVVDARILTNIQLLEKAILKKIEEQSQKGSCFIWIYLTNYPDEVAELYYQDKLTDLQEFINEQMMKTTNWVWIHTIELTGHGRMDKDSYRNGDHFLAELLQQTIEDSSMDETFAPLWKHRQARKYLATLTVGERKAIEEEAENILLFQLTRKNDI